MQPTSPEEPIQATESCNSTPFLLTKAEFSRRQGWAKSTATRYAQQGKLVLDEGGLVNVLESEALLVASRDPSKDRVRARHERERAARELRADGAPDALRVDPSDPTFRAIQKSRAQSEAAKASILQMELAERQGKLVDADKVQRAVFAGIRGIRNRTQQIATRLAPLLAAESDPVKIEGMIEVEVRRIFEDAARELREKGLLDVA